MKLYRLYNHKTKFPMSRDFFHLPFTLCTWCFSGMVSTSHLAEVHNNTAANYLCIWTAWLILKLSVGVVWRWYVQNVNTVCAGILPLATLRYEEHLPCQHWIVLSPSSLLLVDQWVAAFKEQVSRIECDFAGYIASLIHWREWLELKSLKNNISVHIVLTVGFWHKSMWRCRSLNNSNVH